MEQISWYYWWEGKKRKIIFIEHQCDKFTNIKTIKPVMEESRNKSESQK